MRRVIFFTGAGVAAESGIPTFRTGENALWENHRLEEVCHIDSFERNYDLVHQFYNRRYRQPATEALAEGTEARQFIEAWLAP